MKANKDEHLNWWASVTSSLIAGWTLGTWSGLELGWLRESVLSGRLPESMWGITTWAVTASSLAFAGTALGVAIRFIPRPGENPPAADDCPDLGVGEGNHAFDLEPLLIPPQRPHYIRTRRPVFSLLSLMGAVLGPMLLLPGSLQFGVLMVCFGPACNDSVEFVLIVVALLIFLASSPVAVYAWLRGFGRASRLTVDPEGFTVRFAPKGTYRASWGNRLWDVSLRDVRGAKDSGRTFYRDFRSGFVLHCGTHAPIHIPRAGFEAIRASAIARGLIWRQRRFFVERGVIWLWPARS